MSFYQHPHILSKRFRLILASFLQRPDLPLADVLEEQAIEKAFADEDATFAGAPGPLDLGSRFFRAVKGWLSE